MNLLLTGGFVVGQILDLKLVIWGFNSIPIMGTLIFLAGFVRSKPDEPK